MTTIAHLSSFSGLVRYNNTIKRYKGYNMTEQLANGGYLLKSYPMFRYTRPNQIYRLYHKTDGFIVACRTQRQMRNAVRAYLTKGIKSIKGRE